jgi:hypothetical protein
VELKVKPSEKNGPHSQRNPEKVRSHSSFEIWEGKSNTLFLKLGAKSLTLKMFLTPLSE